MCAPHGWHTWLRWRNPHWLQTTWWMWSCSRPTPHLRAEEEAQHSNELTMSVNTCGVFVQQGGTNKLGTIMFRINKKYFLYYPGFVNVSLRLYHDFMRAGAPQTSRVHHWHFTHSISPQKVWLYWDSDSRREAGRRERRWHAGNILGRNHTQLAAVRT